jgi:hypothetical protein
MTAFPYVYGCAATGVRTVSEWCGRRWSVPRSTRLGRPSGTQSVVAVLTISCMALATNLDVFGIDWYVVKWWGFWYVPH